MFEEFGLKEKNSSSYCTRGLILGSKSLYLSEIVRKEQPYEKAFSGDSELSKYCC